MKASYWHLVIRYTGYLLCAFAAASCGTITPSPNHQQLDLVLSGKYLLPEGHQLILPNDNIMALSDEMRGFLRTHIQAEASDSVRLKQLIAAIIHPGLLNLEYNPLRTYTAADTFNYQQGNCLSFSTMLVAMAREIDLKVYFNEVDIPPTWDSQSDGTYVFYKHINVIAQLAGDRQVVDLNLENYNVDFRQHRISDQEAEAQYYNNRGIEHLYQKNSIEAFRYLRKAIDLKPKLSYVWGNLGSLYRREGLYTEAEIAFSHALHLNPNNRVAMSNLSRLHAHLGNKELAQQYRRMVAHFRMNNPFYRYHLAEQALAKRQLESAQQHILAAIKKYKNNHTFHFLAARIYSAQEKQALAKQSLLRATQLTLDEKTKQRYQHKLEQLSNLLAGS